MWKPNQFTPKKKGMRRIKRIKAACICQILHFMLKEDLAHDLAVRQVVQEVENYKKILKRNHIQYKITHQTVLPDEFIQLKVIKQYNASPVGEYLS